MRWVPRVSFQSCWRQEVELEFSSTSQVSEGPGVRRVSYDAFLLYGVWYKRPAFVSPLHCV